MALYGTFIDDDLNSEYKEYYKNGQVKIECSYIDGKKNGTYKEYDESGELIQTTIYENGIEME